LAYSADYSNHLKEEQVLVRKGKSSQGTMVSSRNCPKRSVILSARIVIVIIIIIRVLTHSQKARTILVIRHATPAAGVGDKNVNFFLPNVDVLLLET
jgi:hypothetical protein